MKTTIPALGIVMVITSATFLQACDKESNSAIASDTSTDELIAVALSDSLSGKGDSTYLIRSCHNDSAKDSVSQADLPAAIATYLDENYEGYAFQKAYSVSDTSNTVTGYVVVIFNDDQPLGLEFDAQGNFVSVLEQRRSRERHHR